MSKSAPPEIFLNPSGKVVADPETALSNLGKKLGLVEIWTETTGLAGFVQEMVAAGWVKFGVIQLTLAEIVGLKLVGAEGWAVGEDDGLGVVDGEGLALCDGKGVGKAEGEGMEEGEGEPAVKPSISKIVMEALLKE